MNAPCLQAALRLSEIPPKCGSLFSAGTDNCCCTSGGSGDAELAAQTMAGTRERQSL